MTRRGWIGVGLLLLVVGTAIVLVPHLRGTPVAAVPLTRPAVTQPTPATRPKPQPAAEPPAPPVVTDVLGVVQADNPAYQDKRPLDLPADLPDAAKIVLNNPAYIDPMGNLWLTHPRGRLIADVLAKPIADHTAVVPETVRYVHWPVEGSPPTAIVESGKGWSAVTAAGAKPLPELAEPDFSRAVPLGDGILVPVEDGVVGLLDEKLPKDAKLPFGRTAVVANDTGPTPRGRLHARPILAQAGDCAYIWAPWENGQIGSDGVLCVHADGRVETLGVDQGWPARVIEIVPLADASVLVIAAGDAGPVLKLIPAPEKPATPELIRSIEPLAKQLADPEPEKREAAQRALEAQGPAAYPVLEMMREQLPLEAQTRIETLLGQRLSPTLAGLRLLDGAVHTLARFPGGGCVLKLDGGGTIDAGEDAPSNSVIPATILIRPGQMIQRIDPTAVTDFVPGRQSIQWVGGELIVADPVAGPRRWVGMALLPIFDKSYADFDHVVGIDARRRWLLTSARQPGKTLLIDPTLPDATPRLPVWTLVSTLASAGRDEANWPAIRRGDRLFVLHRDGWQIDKPDQLHTGPEMPIAFDASFRMYTVDHGVITVTNRNDHTAAAKLPADAGDDVKLVPAPGRLFVYSSLGKVFRYSLTDVAGTPKLTLEATFTQGVPRGATLVWLDPAGRLAMAADNTLSVGFTEGRVPNALSELMMHVER